MVVRPTRSRVLALSAVLLLLGGVAAAGAANGEVRVAGAVAAGSTSLSVTALSSGFAFDPDAIGNVPANSTIYVNFTDAGAIPHTFSILRLEGTVLPASSDIPALFAQYGAFVSLNVSGAGDTAFGSFTSPPTGWYEFVCQEAGHFQQGMYGFIAFGEAIPANLTVSAPNTGPGIAIFIISGTIVALVVIALVLGFVIGRRRGSQFEMPPERLGYPEPGAPSEPAAPLPGEPPNR